MLIVGIERKHGAAAIDGDRLPANPVLEALGELRAGEFGIELDEAESVVHALRKYAAKTFLALDDGDCLAFLLEREGGRHPGGATTDDDGVERQFLHSSPRSTVEARPFLLISFQPMPVSRITILRIL